jgi:hypothetical protein
MDLRTHILHVSLHRSQEYFQHLVQPVPSRLFSIGWWSPIMIASNSLLRFCDVLLETAGFLRAEHGPQAHSLLVFSRSVRLVWNWEEKQTRISRSQKWERVKQIFSHGYFHLRYPMPDSGRLISHFPRSCSSFQARSSMRWRASFNRSFPSSWVISEGEQWISKHLKMPTRWRMNTIPAYVTFTATRLWHYSNDSILCISFFWLLQLAWDQVVLSIFSIMFQFLDHMSRE